MVDPVIADAARGFWRQLQQRLDRSRRRLACAQLQHLAEQHQDRDDGCGFEIDRDRAAMSAEGRRERSRGYRSDDAVKIRHAGAERDQREHVEIARHQRLPAAHEERPAGPDHNGRGEHQLNPVRQRLVDPAMPADEMTAHLQHDRRQCEHEADPESARHVGKLGIGRRIEAGDLGLQRHAADRTAAGAGLADLRMHRAGVDRALRRLGLRFGLVEI